MTELTGDEASEAPAPAPARRGRARCLLPRPAAIVGMLGLVLAAASLTACDSTPAASRAASHEADHHRLARIQGLHAPGGVGDDRRLPLHPGEPPRHPELLRRLEPVPSWQCRGPSRRARSGAAVPGGGRPERDNAGDKGWTCFGAPSLPDASLAQFLSTPFLSVWAPGHGADALPKGTGIALPAGSLVIMQVHYNLLVGDKPVKNSLVARHRAVVDAVAPLASRPGTRPAGPAVPGRRHGPIVQPGCIGRRPGATLRS